jgi:hypothetical protein
MATRLVPVLMLAVLGGASPGAAAAEHKCQCLYQGKKFEQGESVCIRVDGTARLARCDMLLNNSSWTFLKGGCPTALFSPAPASRLLVSLQAN